MKPNPRRSRSRGNGKRHSGKSHSFESSGPEGKIRGTAQQVFDKYQALGRDAVSSGDRVAAEGFFQHAEHYFRMMNVDGRANGGNRPDNRGDKPGPEPVEVPISEAPSSPDQPAKASDQAPA